MSYMKNLVHEVVELHQDGLSLDEICLQLEVNYTEVQSIVLNYGDSDVFEMV